MYAFNFFEHFFIHYHGFLHIMFTAQGPVLSYRKRFFYQALMNSIARYPHHFSLRIYFIQIPLAGCIKFVRAAQVILPGLPSQYPESELVQGKEIFLYVSFFFNGSSSGGASASRSFTRTNHSLNFFDSSKTFITSFFVSTERSSTQSCTSS